MKYKELMAALSKETGIGMRTVSEYNKSGQVKSPCKTKVHPTVNDKIDDFDKNTIRQKIHSFWLKREIPTFMKIVQAIDDDPDLPCLSRSSLQRVLKELNLEYTKRSHNSALTERGDLVIWHHTCIEDKRRYRSEGRTMYFLDETWVNAGDCTSKEWMDKTIKSHRDTFLKGLITGSKNSTGKGKRLIVAHIGSAESFVDGGLLCFESKKNTADCHDEMNGSTFYDWFCEVLPRLNDNCIILMDNASYYSVKKDPIPTMAWKRYNIIEWLASKGCVLDKPLVKHVLMQKVNELNIQDTYVIDEEARKSNKIVLRLPPYHSELAWSVVKHHVRSKDVDFKFNEVKALLHEGVERVALEMWSNFGNHTIKEEDKLYDIDFISDELMNTPSLVMEITGDTSSDFSD